MVDINTGRALVSLAARGAFKSRRYKTLPDGTAVFKMHIVVGIYGSIGTAGVMACLLFLPDIAGTLMLMGLIGPLFIPFFMYWLFARLYINEEKIVYRNPLGKRREIAWKDLDAAVRYGIFGDIILYSGGERIRLYPYYSGFAVVMELMQKYRPEAFEPKHALAHAKAFEKEEYVGRTFRWGTAFRVIGLLIMLLGCVFLLLPNRMFTPAFGSQFMGKAMIALIFIACGLPFFMLYIGMRVTIDDDKIRYRNLLGIKKEARWDEITAYRIVDQGGYVQYTRIWYGEKKKMTVSNGFCGYDIIKEIVRMNGEKRKIRFW